MSCRGVFAVLGACYPWLLTPPPVTGEPGASSSCSISLGIFWLCPRARCRICDASAFSAVLGFSSPWYQTHSFFGQQNGMLGETLERRACCCGVAGAFHQGGRCLESHQILSLPSKQQLSENMVASGHSPRKPSI